MVYIERDVASHSATFMYADHVLAYIYTFNGTGTQWYNGGVCISIHTDIHWFFDGLFIINNYLVEMRTNKFTWEGAEKWRWKINWITIAIATATASYTSEMEKGFAGKQTFFFGRMPEHREAYQAKYLHVYQAKQIFTVWISNFWVTFFSFFSQMNHSAINIWLLCFHSYTLQFRFDTDIIAKPFDSFL